MTILNCLPYFPKPGTGTGEAVYGLSMGFISNGSNVTVLAEGSHYEESSYKKVPYIKFKKSNSRNPFNISTELKEYVKKHKDNIDLVLLNGIYVPYMYAFGMFLKKQNINYVHIPHGLYTKHAMGNSPIRKKIYIKLFEKRLMQSAIAVQIFNNNQISVIQGIATPKNFVISPNGVNPDVVNRIRDKTINESLKTKIIFFGRKDVYTKALDLLIIAMKQVTDTNVQLFIVGGDTKDSFKLENLIKRNGLKNVFLEDKFEGNSIEYLQKFDFMINPSRHDAFPMSVLEGMLSGMPIIVSSEVGSSPYVSEANAGLVCEVTPDSIAQSIKQMLKIQKDWHTMGQNGRNFVLRNLNWDTISKDTLINYKALISS